MTISALNLLLILLPLQLPTLGMLAALFFYVSKQTNSTMATAREDRAELKRELKADNAELKRELKADIAELKADNADFRTGLHRVEVDVALIKGHVLGVDALRTDVGERDAAQERATAGREWPIRDRRPAPAGRPASPPGSPER